MIERGHGDQLRMAFLIVCICIKGFEHVLDH